MANESALCTLAVNLGVVRKKRAVLKEQIMKSQHTNSTFISSNKQADTSAYKRSIFPNALIKCFYNYGIE